jgi:hypothetical protein
MSFRENLRRGRSHLLLVVVMIVTAAFVVATEDENLARETGKPPPQRDIAIPEPPTNSGDLAGRSEPREATKAVENGPVAQIGAYDNLRDAQTAAKAFEGNPLATPRIDRPEDANGVYRIVLVPQAASSAEEVCARVKNAGGDCFVRER